MVCARCENDLIGAANYCPTCATPGQQALNMPTNEGLSRGVTYVAMFLLGLFGLVSAHGSSSSGTEAQPQSAARSLGAPSPDVQERLDTAFAQVLRTQWAQTLDVRRYGECHTRDAAISLYGKLGTVAQGPSRLPAVKVRVEFTCAAPGEGVPRRYADFWIVAVANQSIITYRCARVAEHALVVEADPRACAFEPDGQRL
jgi:hypothetical protein